MQKGCWKLESD